MQKFNVGDKVKVVKLDNRVWVEIRKRLGQIGTVIKPDPTDCQIEFADGKKFFFRYCELEKVEEDFKIGEEVYINYSYYKNTFAKIVSIDGSYIEVIFELSIYPTRGYTFHKDYISKQPINTKTENQTEKIMNKTPEQIDSEIDNLKAQIAKLEKEKEDSTFEVGDWVVCLKNTSLGFYTKDELYEIIKIDENDLFTRFNNYNGQECSMSKFNCRKATPAEIEAHLIKLAEESGLRIGKEARGTINYLEPKQRIIVKFEIYTFKNKGYNSIRCNSYLEKYKLKYGLAIRYNNGFCSYPFDYISHLSQKFQPKITINGYDAEFCQGYVKFGCASFSNQMFRETKNYIDYVNKIYESNKTDSKNYFTNRKVESIKFGAGIFTPTDIENIVKWLKD